MPVQCAGGDGKGHQRTEGLPRSGLEKNGQGLIVFFFQLCPLF